MPNTLDVAVVGESYSRREQALFLSDLELIKGEFFLRLWQRQSQIRFIPLTWSNKFQCKDSSGFDGGLCNDGKVAAEVQSAGLNPPPYGYLVLSKNLRGGGGGAVCLVGTYDHNALNTGNTAVHELAHSLFGLQHDGGFMNGSANHGAAGSNMTFTVAQFAQINQLLNLKAGYLPTSVPVVTITSPTQGQTIAPGSTVMFSARLTGLVQHVNIHVDGILQQTMMYWGDSQRNPYCNPTDGIRFFINTLTPGQHTFTMYAYDINNQVGTASVTVTIL